VDFNRKNLSQFQLQSFCLLILTLALTALIQVNAQVVVSGTPAAEVQVLLNWKTQNGWTFLDWNINTDPCTQWSGTVCDTNQSIFSVSVTNPGGQTSAAFNSSLTTLPSLSSLTIQGFLFTNPLPVGFPALVQLSLSSCDNVIIPTLWGSFTPGFSSFSCITCTFGAAAAPSSSLDFLTYMLQLVQAELDQVDFYTGVKADLTTLFQNLPLTLNRLVLNFQTPNKISCNFNSLQLVQLTALQELIIQNAGCLGALPDITGLTLNDIIFKNNRLTGTIPDVYAIQCSGCFYDFSNNALSGLIPTFPTNTPIVVVLDNNAFLCDPGQNTPASCQQPALGPPYPCDCNVDDQVSILLELKQVNGWNFLTNWIVGNDPCAGQFDQLNFAVTCSAGEIKYESSSSMLTLYNMYFDGPLDDALHF
jgi:hypothetical protein